MNLRKIVSALMCAVMVFTCCASIYAANPVIKVNVSIAQGESKDLSTYMKGNGETVKWSGGNAAIATVNGNTVTGKKVGSTKYTGTSSSAKYEFTIKVLTDYSTPTVIDTEKKDNKIKNSDGETLNYKDREITMGINDVVDISNLLDKEINYYNCSWSVSNEKLLTFKQGKLTAKAEGKLRVTARPRTNKNKNTIYRFYVTVDSNCLSKNISVAKNTLTPLSTYLGESPNNYVFTAKSVNGSGVSVKDGYISAGNSTGYSVLTAESTTGGTNYCFVVKIR